MVSAYTGPVHFLFDDDSLFNLALVPYPGLITTMNDVRETAKGL